MTDTQSSDAPLAQAADTPAPATGAETTAVKFGSTRGSGLARGKRPSGASAPATSPVKTEYKPTAVEVITPQREYKNPFASPEPASAPASQPAEVQAPEAAATLQPAPSPAPETPVSPEPVAERPELQILPPAETSRPAVSWEAPAAHDAQQDTQADDRPTRDDRPSFRPDRREDRGGTAQSQGRPRFERRDSRRDRDPYWGQPRDPRDEEPQEARGEAASRAPQAPKPSGGFLGWIKSLFGGAKPAEAPAVPVTGGEPSGDGHRHRRRHRGGRGRSGQQGFRAEHSGNGDRAAQGGPREDRGGERYGGRRRGRHRGGSGRGRDEFRSEGQKGGGAI